MVAHPDPLERIRIGLPVSAGVLGHVMLLLSARWPGATFENASGEVVIVVDPNEEVPPYVRRLLTVLSSGVPVVDDEPDPDAASQADEIVGVLERARELLGEVATVLDHADGQLGLGIHREQTSAVWSQEATTLQMQVRKMAERVREVLG